MFSLSPCDTTTRLGDYCSGGSQTCKGWNGVVSGKGVQEVMETQRLGSQEWLLEKAMAELSLTGCALVPEKN